jgi:DnaD/phage-associated family protein
LKEGTWLKMAKFRMVRTDFWKNPIVSEEMSPEDKYFYLYLLTNPHTTQIGIYKITKKQMAFDLGYSIESVHSLMDRFIKHYKYIRYNPDTRELAIKNWAKENLHKGGKPVMDCIYSELKEVEDSSLIQYVAESISKQEIRSLYESFCEQGKRSFCNEDRDHDENDTYIEMENDESHDTFLQPFTIRGQKEKEKEKEKQQQEQKSFNPTNENNRNLENLLQSNQETEDVKEIIQFWDANGFGFTNENAKQQLLSWLDDSSFLQPKEIILKAMKIACANNKRKLNYIVGILKNWENESLLTVEEIDDNEENQSSVTKQHKQSNETTPAGRYIPNYFVLDLTAGEE